MHELLANEGFRQVNDGDVRHIIDSIGSFTQSDRLFLGDFVFGLNVNHYKLMKTEEQKEFFLNIQKSTTSNILLLLNVFNRHLSDQIVEFRKSIKYSCNAFPLIVNQTIVIRMVEKFRKLYTPKMLQKQRSFNDFSSMSFNEIYSFHIEKNWHACMNIIHKFDATQHQTGSDEHYRHEIAKHMINGHKEMDSFQKSLLDDLDTHFSKISDLEDEIFSLIPERIILVSDTEFALDNDYTKEKLNEYLQQIESI